MNEIEYILRIVLKARDELAGALAAARRELNGLTTDMGKNQSKIDAFNTSMATMDSNVENITNKFKAWRAVIQGVEDGNDDAKKSFGDLGREVDKTQKTTTRALKSQADYTEQASKLKRNCGNSRLRRTTKMSALSTHVFSMSGWQKS